MDYHVFKKPVVGKNGKIEKRWYYWYVLNGKQYQKICKNCRTRAEAEAFISELPDVNKLKLLISDVAKDMYLPGSEHVSRREQLGRSVVRETLHEARIFTDHIIKRWGSYRLDEITVSEVGNYLMALPRSGSWKNRYVSIFREIFDEAAWYNVKVMKPNFPRFARKRGDYDVLSSDELKILFTQENFTAEKTDAETLFLFFYCTVYAGLRISETRALRTKQFLFDRDALIIDGYCKRDGTRTSFNKKGSIEKPKHRAVCLPEDLMARMQLYIIQRNKKPDDFVFTNAFGDPLRVEYMEDVFTRALGRTKINTTDRKLTPHSLRYTYITKMRRMVSGDDVMKLAGHTEVGMTDYYNTPSIEDALAGIADLKPAVKRLFD